MKKAVRAALGICLILLALSVTGSFADGVFTLPADVTRIEDECFYGVPVREMRLHDGATYIGSKAFAYTQLEILYIPRSVQYIAPDAFEGSDSLIPAVYAGSYADQWCKDRGMTAWKIVGPGTAAHSEDEIRAFVSAHPAETISHTTYRRLPSTSPCVPGLISEESTQNAINMLNQIRFIAGLNADVENDPSWEEKLGAAAMANGLNSSISHDPRRPSVWEGAEYDELYQMARIGSSSSNLAAGRDNLAGCILYGYMYDSQPYNVSCVGHRRWILNPAMGRTAFGYYRTGSGYRYYSAMYAFDRSGSGRQAPVVWPARKTPLSYFAESASHAWSVSFGTFLSEDAVRVRLTRRSDGRTWNFSSGRSDGDFYVDNVSYGMTGCVIFRPAGMGAVSVGDSFDVTVINESDYTILEYTVTFFAL